MNVWRGSILAVLLLWLAASARTQDPNRIGTATLSVTSPTPGVVVVLDSCVLGSVPIESIIVNAGIHRLLTIHPESASWYRAACAETLYIEPGTTLRREAVFPTLCRISTDPPGASWLRGDSVGGTTPAVLPVMPTVTLSLPGYRDTLLALPPSGGNVQVLLRLNPGGVPREPLVRNSRRGSDLALYIAGGTAILAGAAAASFRIAADNAYADYLAHGGDPADRQTTRRLDVAAGICLAVSQAGLIWLGMELLSR